MRPETFTVCLPGPLDIPSSVEFLRSWGDDGIDRWDGRALVRTLPVGHTHVAYACRPSGSREAPVLHVRVADAAFRQEVEEAVRVTFVPPPPAYADLLARDPLLARLEQQHPGVRPVRQFDLLTALIRCITAQQVNLRWATTVRRRLAEAFGDRHVIDGHSVYSLHADRLAAATVAELRALQLTARKAESIIRVAEAIAGGRLTLAELAELPDEEVIARLTALPGIGRWSAEWILARTLGRPRVVAGDLGVRKAVGLAYLDTLVPLEHAVRAATAHWGEAALTAQALLLYAYTHGSLCHAEHGTPQNSQTANF
jgi:DNA-3-methyladenine glycosylase II